MWGSIFVKGGLGISKQAGPAGDLFCHKATKTPLGTILGASSSFLGHFKDAKKREVSDWEAWKYALPAAGLEMAADHLKETEIDPYLKELRSQFKMALKP
ncbi:MAG: hypothetical protein IIV90_01810 [Oscillospiraceae bacterium]|nr:hypothetical protein [Oscillospiraceae bacterium]